MILIPIIIFLIIITLFFSNKKFDALVFLISTKSIVDAFWSYKIGPFTPVSAQGLLILILYLPLINFKIFKKSWTQTAIILFIAYTISLILSFPFKPVAFFENLSLTLLLFLGFFLFPKYVNNNRDLNKILFAFVICGIFPSIVSIYQDFTGQILTDQVRQTSGDLIRNVGFYHDAFAPRFFSLLTIFSCTFYLIYNKFEYSGKKLLIVAQLFLSSYSLYLVYSKAGILIIIAWLVLFVSYSKLRFKLIIYFIPLFALYYLFFENQSVSSNIESLFSKELNYNSGALRDVRYTLAGRGWIWERYWDDWQNNRNLFFQFFGNGISRPVHNEFFRIFLMNGFIGVFLFILVLLTMLYESFKLNSKDKTLALMLLSMYLIDCTGLVPGQYYFYNIVLWGFLGILFRVNMLNFNNKKFI